MLILGRPKGYNVNLVKMLANMTVKLCTNFVFILKEIE